MAKFIMNLKWLAVLRATRATPHREAYPAAAETAAAEGSGKTYDENNERDPSHRMDDHSEDEVSDDVEIETPVEVTREDGNAVHIPARSSGSPEEAIDDIKLVWKYVAAKITLRVTQAKDAVVNAVEKVKQVGFIDTTKAVGAWIRLHPWEAAVVFLPVATLAFIAVALAVTGFGPAGIAAGSTAAVIQASIGNVVVGSIFATCTSAMMGGYGALIVFGGAWLGSTAVMIGLATAWKRWTRHSERTMVLSGRGSPKPDTDESKQAVPDVMFWTMFATAYVVYRFKSWYRGRADGKSPVRKRKDEWPVKVRLTSRRRTSIL